MLSIYRSLDRLQSGEERTLVIQLCDVAEMAKSVHGVHGDRDMLEEEKGGRRDSMEVEYEVDKCVRDGN